jgi:Phage tail tube protein
MSQTLAPTTPTNQRIAGITRCTVDGQRFPLVEFSWDPFDQIHSTVTSLSGVDGYRSLPKAPYMAGKLRDSGSTSVTAFGQKTNSTVVFTLANGKQIVGHNLWFVDMANVNGADADFDFRFEGVAGTIVEVPAKAGVPA